MDLKAKKVFLMDMDGTFYLGNTIIPGSLDFIDRLQKNGKSFYFLTNNSSRDANFYALKLNNMGLKTIHKSQIITSGEICAWYLQSLKPNGKVYLLGTKELERDLLKVGLVSVQNDPDFIVLGFDKTLTYHKLERACYFIRQGIPFFATHPDINCPTEDGPIPDTGSMIKMIEESTGISPKIFGKPYPEVIEYVSYRTKTTQNEIVMIGDRLYTDIAMGKKSGITTILVLTGETQKDDVKESPWQPDYVFPSLSDIDFN
ncbi:MAG: HAD-IIA family hydrolase [Atribacterota bacterium]|jgi:4-nitrophenyl phosphatase/NagD protein|nr:HAD-IIA family hydrolase [Atribacterota bacterium]